MLGRIPDEVLAAVKDGMPMLVAVPDGSLAEGVARQLAAAGAFTYHGQVGGIRAPWMGNWLFVREHACPCQKLDRPQGAANSQGRQRVEGVAEQVRATDFMAAGTGGRSSSQGPESSRTSVDSRSANIPPQSENNSSSRPPFVAVMQSADLRQFNDRPQLRRLNRSGLRCIFLQR